MFYFGPLCIIYRAIQCISSKIFHSVYGGGAQQNHQPRSKGARLTCAFSCKGALVASGAAKAVKAAASSLQDYIPLGLALKAAWNIWGLSTLRPSASAVCTQRRAAASSAARRPSSDGRWSDYCAARIRRSRCSRSS